MKHKINIGISPWHQFDINLKKVCVKDIAIRCVFAIVILSSAIALNPAGAENSEDIYHAAPGQPIGTEIFLKAESAISITLPDDILNWALDPKVGTNLRKVNISVKANQNWRVIVCDMSPLTCGHMTKCNTSSNEYDPQVKLASPMTISADFGEIELPYGGIIAAGSATEEEGRYVELTFKQPVSWSDIPLDDRNEYRINIALFAFAVPDITPKERER